VLTIGVKGNDVGGTWLAHNIVKTCLEGRTLAEIKWVLQHSRPRVAGKVSAVIGTPVIDAENVREVMGKILNDSPNHFRFIEYRNHNPRVPF